MLWMGSCFLVACSFEYPFLMSERCQATELLLPHNIQFSCIFLLLFVNSLVSFFFFILAVVAGVSVKADSPSVPSVGSRSIRRLDLGGVTYVQTAPGKLVRKTQDVHVQLAR